MRTALLLLAILAASSTFAASQTVWKWVDERGVTHYSDRPMPGATKMELSVGSRSTEEGNASSASFTSETPADAEPSGPAYPTLEIWKPAPGDNIVNTGGEVQVNVRIEPTLRAGHSLVLYLDGRQVPAEAGNILEYTLTEVARGEHSLTARVNNSRGQRVQESETVRFSVQQTSIANPPVGPALRSPPKPRPGGSANKPLATQPSYAALNGQAPRIDPATNRPVKPASKPKPPKKP